MAREQRVQNNNRHVQLTLQNFRWIRLRPPQRCGRPGARYLDQGRQDCRPSRGSGGASDARLGGGGIGDHARRDRYALPHRRSQSEYGPQDASRGSAVGGTGPPHVQDPQRYDGECPQHVCHWLQVRRHGIHHRLRCCRPAPVGPACPRGVRGHALYRQGVLCPDGQQSLCDESDSAKTSRSESRLSSPGCWGPRRVTPSSWSIPAAWKSGNITPRAT